MKFYLNGKTKAGNGPKKFIYLIVNAQDKYEAKEKAQAKYPDHYFTYDAQEITEEI